MITGAALLSWLVGWAAVEFAGTAIPGIIAVVAKFAPAIGKAFSVGKAVHSTGLDSRLLSVLHKAATGESHTEEEKKYAAQKRAELIADPGSVLRN